MRTALFEVCEIGVLVNYDPKVRDAFRTVQRELLEKTKAKHNILPHEGKSMLPDPKSHQLLPSANA